MIRYTLKCSSDHRFESWFASAEAFDKLHGAGLVACPDCGGSDVAKTLMAPGVRTARAETGTPPAAAPALRSDPSPLEQKLVALRKHVEATSDYVGVQFATEARRMHDGEIPHRPIYGEAKPKEARQLIEDGVPVAPLPFLPSRKSN